MAIDPLTAKPEDHPWAASKRFGLLAYMAPVESWPTVEEIANKYDLGLSVSGPDTFRFTYNRTGRSLGDVVSSRGGGRIRPYAADQILDYAEHLDRVDPNYTKYTASSGTVTPFTQALSLVAPREFVRPVAQTKTPYGNSLQKALSIL